jgi:hypothetical protein
MGDFRDVEPAVHAARVVARPAVVEQMIQTVVAEDRRAAPVIELGICKEMRPGLLSFNVARDEAGKTPATPGPAGGFAAQSKPRPATRISNVKQMVCNRFGCF